MILSREIKVPLDVPKERVDTYKKNFAMITRGTGNLMLFAGDQKIEHMNDDFSGQGIAPDDADPEHLFRIAGSSKIGVFATQLGLIARYGMDYSDVPYLVKLNSKTNLVKMDQKDPLSEQIWTVEQVEEFRQNSGLTILAVGYTIYPGSEYESIMLTQAARIIYEAHQAGLITVIWSYPRGKGVKDEKDPHVIAGAVGLAACLGADFIKINYPKREGQNSALLLREATLAAGRARVLCAGGPSEGEREFLQTLHEQIHIGGAAGSATGRNIHQKPFHQAVGMCNAIFAITCEGASVKEACDILFRAEEPVQIR